MALAGHTKNGEFLRDDYISAIEKAGPLREVKKMLPSGTILTKKKSDICKVIVTDRGGGCQRALTLIEEALVILADTCKGHGADLLIEDCGQSRSRHT